MLLLPLLRHVPQILHHRAERHLPLKARVKALLPTWVKVEDEKLTNLIKNLNDTVQPGSAGSSLKAATAARDFIRWADGCELTDGDIEKVVTEALSSYDDTEKGTFFEAWSLVKSSYETIKAGGDDAAELLQSAGVEGEVTVNENADKAFSALDSAINTVVVSTEE